MRGLLDALDEIYTCEFGLQAYAMATMSQHCHSLLTDHSGSPPEAVLLHAMQSVVLPHTFCLPVSAVPTFFPSIMFARGEMTVEQQAVASVLCQTAFAGIGVLVPPSSSRLLSVSLPANGIPVSGIVVDKCRVVLVSKRRRTCRAVVVCKVGRDQDCQRVVTAIAESAARGEPFSGTAELRHALSYHSPTNRIAVDTSTADGILAERCIVSYFNNQVCLLMVAADMVLLLQEYHHARLLNTLAYSLRCGGVPCADVIPPYVYTVSVTTGYLLCHEQVGCALHAMWLSLS
jgi:hypothetical protein